MVNAADLAFHGSFALIGYALYGTLGAGVGLLLSVVLIVLAYGGQAQEGIEP